MSAPETAAPVRYRGSWPASLHRELCITTGNARRYIHPLVHAGIILEFTDRARNRAWSAPEIPSALNEFAQRASRRTLPGPQVNR